MEGIIILDYNGGIAKSLNRKSDIGSYKIFSAKNNDEIDQILIEQNVDVVMLLYVFELETELFSFMQNYNYPFLRGLVPINKNIYQSLTAISYIKTFDIQQPHEKFLNELVEYIETNKVKAFTPLDK